MLHDWNKFLESCEAKINLFSKENILCDLTHLGLIKVKGRDAKKLLQGQLTYDVEKINPLQSAIAAQCNSQGRVISLFYLFYFQDSYYMCMQRNLLTLALTALKKYAIFYQVELTDASDTFAIIGCANSHSCNQNTPVNINHFVKIPITHSHHLIIGELASLKIIWKELAQILFVADKTAWQAFTISQGIPTLYAETSGKFLPQEINLDQLNAISFEKGCYTGQEIIARLHYRGKLKNRMVRAKITSKITPRIGSNIYSQTKTNPCGLIVDVVDEMQDQYSMLLIADEMSIKNNCIYLENEKNLFTITE
jgi:tRNA-modifying protein YgfZ